MTLQLAKNNLIYCRLKGALGKQSFLFLIKYLIKHDVFGRNISIREEI
jgi:hypothetical protein